MTKLTLALILTLSVLLFGGCATTGGTHSLTPLEIQSMQTRSYSEDYNTVFRSVVSVFQDLGYTIRNADIATGFIQADGSARANESLKFWTGSTETTQTRATGFVEKIGNNTHVRLNFVTAQERSTIYGANDRKEEPILDAGIYQNAFEQVGNAIFVRQAVH